MPTYSTSEFRAGLKLMLDGDPCNIIENIIVKPGKGQAFNRVKLRNLKTDRVVEKTFKSGETVEAADIMDYEMQYLYSDGGQWHFMDPKTFEQFAVNTDTMGDTKRWIKEEDLCVVTMWNGAPLSIESPNFTVLRVVETDPGVRGDTASGGSKPAKLETGATVQVPLFIEVGDLLRVDTRKGEYVSRAK